jgi:hypothetical protein
MLPRRLTNIKIPCRFHIPLLIIVGVLIRIPILTDPALLIDGDEAVVGLMASDWLKGGEFPIYFIGQQYGLSTLEACTAGLFFSIFGMTDWALKLSSLTIWLTGVVFFYKALIQYKPQKKQIASIVSFILVTAPTWLYWGMKSRGGYVSAFMFSAILLFLITKQNEQWSNPRSIAIGACLALISQFQSLWIISILPVSVYFILNSKQLSQLKFIAVGFLGTLLPLVLIKFKQPTVWKPHLLRFDNEPLPWLTNLPDVLLHHFSGTYYLGGFAETNLLALLFSSAMLMVIGISFALVLYKNSTSKNWYNLNSLLLVSILANIFITLFLIPGARYLLPVLAIVLLLLFNLAAEGKKSVMFIPVILVSLSVSASFSRPFRQESETYKFQTQLTKATMKKLINGLEEEGITNFFIMNAMGQHQIMFYGKGEINARFLHEKDRMQNRIDAVAEAFKNKEKTAFVLLKTADQKHFSESQMRHLLETVSLVINPTTKQLEAFGFETSDLQAPKRRD